ncbi:MAG: VCBS repeat-containing protein [Deltaproteobacteria bacterium]|nr:VCBS repeat-containing protein [Deltaproteobacteria bacterium]
MRLNLTLTSTLLSTLGIACGGDDGAGGTELADTSGGRGSADSTGNPVPLPPTVSEIGSVGLGFEPRAIIPVDVDGDGMQDLVVVHQASTDQLQILLADGAGGVAAPIVIGTDGPLAGAAAGDLDGDGNVDLALMLESANAVAVAVGDGAGGFTVGTPMALDGFAGEIAVADMNGDAALDIVASVRAMGGGGGSIVWVSGPDLSAIEEVASFEAAPQTLVIDDFDGDGAPDIAATLGEALSAALVRGDGGGGFTPTPMVSAGVWLGSAASIDLAGGDTRQLVAASLIDEAIAVFSADASGFGDPEVIASPGGPFGLTVMDLDVDGNDDIVVSAVTTSEVSVHVGTGAALASGQLVLGLPAAQRLGALTPVALGASGRPALALLERGTVDVPGTLHLLSSSP